MHHTLFFSFLTHPQHCEQWVGAEHADPMLRDMLLQGAGAGIMPGAPRPLGSRITMVGALVLRPV